MFLLIFQVFNVFFLKSFFFCFLEVVFLVFLCVFVVCVFCCCFLFSSLIFLKASLDLEIFFKSFVFMFLFDYFLFLLIFQGFNVFS